MLGSIAPGYDHITSAITGAVVVSAGAAFAPFLKKFRWVDMGVLQALPWEEIQGTGFVLHTLETSLWRLLHTEDYRSCILAVMNLGDDSDTTEGVAGGLAGLRDRDIPGEWLAVLTKSTEIEAICDAFDRTIPAEAIDNDEASFGTASQFSQSMALPLTNQTPQVIIKNTLNF